MKMTPAEFRERFRVSVGTLPDGSKIEVTAFVVTNANFSSLPSVKEYRDYLRNLYGRSMNFILERFSTTNNMVIFEFFED